MQLPKGYGDAEDCPEKKKFAAIFQAVQVHILTCFRFNTYFYFARKGHYKLFFRYFKRTGTVDVHKLRKFNLTVKFLLKATLMVLL